MATHDGEMMRNFVIKILLVAMTSVCSATQICVGTALALPTSKESPRVLWERRYGDERFWHKYKAVATNNKGEVLIGTVVTKPPRESDSLSNRLLIWKINQNGEVVDEIEIKPPQAAGKEELSNSAAVDIHGLTPLDNGDILLVVEFQMDHFSIVKVDKTGKKIWVKEIGEPSRQIWISEIIPMADGGFLLIGHESLDALAIKIDTAGNILWEKKEDRGQMDLFVDGIVSEEGGSILLGNSGNYDILRRGASTIWIGKYDSTGEKKIEKNFTGRYGSITRSSDGGYAVVYDKGTSEGQDIWVQSFSHDLEKLWETQILTVKSGFSKFKIVGLSDGGFIIAGDNDGKAYAAKIDTKGNKVWTFWEETIDRASLDYGLISFNKEVMIVSSIYIQKEQRNIQQKIRVIKLAD